jgi:hypothetical protein
LTVTLNTLNKHLWEGKGGIPPYQLSWSDGIVSGVNNEIMNQYVMDLVIFSVTDSFGLYC